MAELVETDVEKAKLSTRQRRAVRTQNAIDGELRAGTRRMLVGSNLAISRGPNRRGHGPKRPPSDRLLALRSKFSGVRKSSDPVATPFPIALQMTDDAISISFRIEKATKTGRYVAGWLSVVEKDGKVIEDTQEDRISLDELRKGVHKYMRGSRVIKKQHSGDQIGEMVEVLVIDDDVAKALGATTTKRGAWGMAEITDAATRDDVVKGRVTGWSMGGKGKRTEIAKAGFAPLRETDYTPARR